LPLTVLDSEHLSVTASTKDFPETAGGGASVLLITRSNTNVTLPLTVYLTSSDTSAIRVPESVVIGAGQRSVQVGLTAIDDRLSGADKLVEVLVEAGGYTEASEYFFVRNFQAIATVLQHSALVWSEPAMRSTEGTVSLRNPAPLGGLQFSVSATPAGVLGLPQSIRISEGETQVAFPISFTPGGIQDERVLVKMTISGLDMTSETRMVLLRGWDASWTNNSAPLDVDDNGFTDPLDVLAIINTINLHGSRLLDNEKAIDRALEFVDVDEDGFVSPLDVLDLVNYLNRI
jgi:hypothetical protein